MNPSETSQPLKCLLKYIFFSKICWPNPAKASFMHHQWTASVYIFKVSHYRFFGLLFKIYVLTQASVITCKQNFYTIPRISFTCLTFIIHFSKINLKNDWCLLLMVWLLNSQGMKNCKSTASFCLSTLTLYTNDWSV